MIATVRILMLLVATLISCTLVFLMYKASEEDTIYASAAKIIILEQQLINNKQQLSDEIYYHKKLSLIEKVLREKKHLRMNKIRDYLSSHHSDINANTNPIPLVGYSLLRLVKVDANNKLYKRFMRNVIELYGQINAVVICRHLWATSISNTMIGIAISLLLSVLLLSNGKSSQGYLVVLLGIAISLLVGYMGFDDVIDKVKKRKTKFKKDFPRVITKLALLVGAGMELGNAWRTTAFSGKTLLYIEMQTVCRELDNGFLFKDAYQNFNFRCNVKEVSKLGAVVEQAYRKGNSELASLLRDISADIWEERKHNARRLGELANSRLLLPIMMTLVGIMILVIGPIMSNLGY